MHCKTTIFVLMLRAGNCHWTIVFKSLPAFTWACWPFWLLLGVTVMTHYSLHFSGIFSNVRTYWLKRNLSTSLIGTNFCKPFVILADVMSPSTGTWELSWGGISWMALPSPTSKSLMICHNGGVNGLYEMCISQVAPAWGVHSSTICKWATSFQGLWTQTNKQMYG